MSLVDLYQKKVITIQPDATLQEALELMDFHRIGDVVVVKHSGKNKIPVGILTDRDVAMQLYKNSRSFKDHLVRDFMSEELVMGENKDGLYEVIKKMKDNGVRRLPVINERGFLNGIICVDDIITLLAEELTCLARINTIQREKVNDEVRQAFEEEAAF